MMPQRKKREGHLGRVTNCDGAASRGNRDERGRTHGGRIQGFLYGGTQVHRKQVTNTNRYKTALCGIRNVHTIFVRNHTCTRFRSQFGGVSGVRPGGGLVGA